MLSEPSFVVTSFIFCVFQIWIGPFILFLKETKFSFFHFFELPLLHFPSFSNSQMKWNDSRLRIFSLNKKNFSSEASTLVFTPEPSSSSFPSVFLHHDWKKNLVTRDGWCQKIVLMHFPSQKIAPINCIRWVLDSNLLLQICERFVLYHYGHASHSNIQWH